MNTCNQVEFARLFPTDDGLGVNKSTVTRWKQAGRLVLDEQGRILIAESIARVLESRAGRDDVADRHARNRGRNLPETLGAPQQDDEDDQDIDLGTDYPPDADTDGTPARTRYKARVLKYENARIKLELSLRHGYRLPRGTVQREAQGIGNTLRAALERLIDVSAPQCAHLDRAGRLSLLTAEAAALRRILLTELARSQRRIRKETRNV